ncbi:exodeoxyribonuclease VII large subunit [Thiolapillus brandeum]|uniref:Exodeoxyribonuclease 7 large subunit n=1 Tax=Thiolapillus brandeum TaxID=1076588 RepID=A0A7U6GHC0_9GAMM|nr:exodeoxyribonuclease VII large subunit [Thiolapillus brandeum]BAO43603.1 exodeoxyribonuclease VII large subunit [Thiolapillus brandeum]
MPHTPNRDIWSVSRLNGEIRAVLEGSFPLLWVEGEISNLATPRSGHSYFSLKDEHAQVRCALFRNKRMLLRFQPRDGNRVLVRARISLYEARGDFQLIIEHMEPAGEGALQRAFEALKAKLEQEGLFDSKLKKPLPPFPRCVGVVTSPTGAAVRDILQVLKRRFPGLPVIIYPTLVQGEDAAAEITQTLKLADERGDCDLLILARGGGSLEDLWAFNDETLARTLAAMKTPVISAVGHEVDFTICDFVADRRAPTPSAAAELATPDSTQLEQQLNTLGKRLELALRRLLDEKRQHLEHSHHKLRLLHPLRRIQEQQQRLDDLGMRLETVMQRRLASHSQQLEALQSRLYLLSPSRRLETLGESLTRQHERLQTAMNHVLSHHRLQLQALSGELHAVSPLQTLARGYSITTDAKTGKVITRASETAVGSEIKTRLHQGALLSVVVDPGSE